MIKLVRWLPVLLTPHPHLPGPSVFWVTSLGISIKSQERGCLYVGAGWKRREGLLFYVQAFTSSPCSRIRAFFFLPLCPVTEFQAFLSPLLWHLNTCSLALGECGLQVLVCGHEGSKDLGVYMLFYKHFQANFLLSTLCLTPASQVADTSHSCTFLKFSAVMWLVSLRSFSVCSAKLATIPVFALLPLTSCDSVFQMSLNFPKIGLVFVFLRLWLFGWGWFWKEKGAPT